MLCLNKKMACKKTYIIIKKTFIISKRIRDFIIEKTGYETLVKISCFHMKNETNANDKKSSFFHWQTALKRVYIIVYFYIFFYWLSMRMGIGKC